MSVMSAIQEAEAEITLCDQPGNVIRQNENKKVPEMQPCDKEHAWHIQSPEFLTPGTWGKKRRKTSTENI